MLKVMDSCKLLEADKIVLLRKKPQFDLFDH